MSHAAYTLPPVYPSYNYTNKWKQNICKCGEDEESCWWSTWCCWLVQARTYETFGLSTSWSSIVRFWLFILFVFFSLIFLGPLFPLLVIGGSLYYASKTSLLRSKIRDVKGIKRA